MKAAVTGVADSPVAELGDEALVLDFADEESVVQTRFPTSLLLLARAAFGDDVGPAARAGGEARSPRRSPSTRRGSTTSSTSARSWTYGLAQEAALKIREAAQAWSESYPLLDYRHGPLAVAGETSLVWLFGQADPALAADIERTGATVQHWHRRPADRARAGAAPRRRARRARAGWTPTPPVI